MVDALAEHDYIAKAPNELTIKKGDIIRDVVRKQDGWWEGVLNDRRGVFPDTFVRPMDKEPSTVVYRSKKEVSKVRRCRVAFSYKQDHEDELNLNVGDVIEVLGEEEEGWWRGVLNGKEGVFPSNFVVEIKGAGSREDLGEAGEEKSPNLPPKPEKLLCEVKYPYKSQNSDELNLKVGDVVTVLSQEGQDPGWWFGELNGQTGVFPDNFVVLLTSGTSEKKHKDSPIKPSSIAQQRRSLEQNERTEGDSNKTTPPVPGKKPFVPIKKSPSGGGSSGGLFSGLKKKIADAVDGGAGSKGVVIKAEVKQETNSETNAENAFDQVERRPLLSDVRATRAKAPGRRPPSVVFKEGEPGVVNGNMEHSMLDSVTELSNSTPEPENAELKPKLREWEKHKAPWLEEMKLNQAKRTSTSPGPEQNKLKLTPTDRSENDETSSSKDGSPIEMTKSMSALGRPKTSPNEPDKTTRMKPVQPVPTRPQTIHTSNESQPQKPKLTSPVLKTPKPSFANDDPAPEHVPYKQYSELLERIEKLEALVKRQNELQMAAIEDLKSRLQVETDLRLSMQSELEKMGQCVMHF